MDETEFSKLENKKPVATNNQPFVTIKILIVMSKLSKPLQFDYELKERVIENTTLKTLSIGTVTIEGHAYFNPNTSRIDVLNRYDFDIDFIYWNGTDVREIIRVYAETLYADILEAAIRKGAGLFEPQIEEAA